MKTHLVTESATTATATSSGDLGIRALGAPRIDAALSLERLLPSDLWKRVQRDPVARELGQRIDGELLAPLSFDRENLAGAIARLRGPESFDREKLEALRGEMRECVERLGNIDNQMAAEISRGPAWVRPGFESLRRGLNVENSRLNGDLVTELRRRFAGLSAVAEPSLAPIRVLGDAEFSPASRPFVRLRDNPLRAAITECTMHVSGMPTAQMALSIRGMVAKTLPLSLKADGCQNIAANNTGEHSTVAPGYYGPSMYPDLDGMRRSLQGLFRINAPVAAEREQRLDLSAFVTPIGIVDIAVRQPERIPGAAAWVARAVSAAHRNVEITFIAPVETEDRGNNRISQRGIVIGMNLAVPADTAARIEELSARGNSLELIRDLMENPPAGRAGSILRWIRSGIIDPSLASEDEAPVTWERATSAQRNRAFERFAGTSRGRSLGDFSSKLHALGREPGE